MADARVGVRLFVSKRWGKRNETDGVKKAKGMSRKSEKNEGKK